MVKKADSERADELALLRDWSICVARFICDQNGAIELFKQFEETIGSAFDRGDLRGLKVSARDNTEWAKDLPPDQHHRLDVLLVTKFGKGLTDEATQMEEEIEQILLSGRINDEDQYRLLLARVDAIFEDEPRNAELEKINSLLAAYN